MIYLLLATVPLAVAVCYTAFQTRKISSAYPADGAFVEVNGRLLHYHHIPAAIEDPKADPLTLVFLHGASGNAKDPLLAFGDKGAGRYPMLFFDRPGLGHSTRELVGDAAPKAQAKLLAAALAKMGVERCVVIGHSLGASIAAALGLLEPARVRGLVFLAPATHPWPGGVSWYYRAAALPVIGPIFCWTLTLPIGRVLAPKSIDNVFAPSSPPDGYADAIHLDLLFRPHSFRANALDVAHLKPHLQAQSQDYTSLEQPALIFTGTKDTVVWPSIHSDGLKRDLPNAELFVLDDAGHMPHLTHSTEIFAAIEELADRVEHDRAARSVAQ
ncbi:alpha/beta hydrolase fold protein [Roseibium sp. TrichSKD4]|uniref:alpha/beta fold hydrolase n=1 Tax=Roseibium sp. TrichSKD4 TaxID=744980 RepID=UPI0001E56CD9|nr:alpha/beta hydrolase [Roseibium sp. TrichSKD4]EFO31448.1 alpha/beta hydrolase fold protein [Roseibium sp. TrichSKD4]